MIRLLNFLITKIEKNTNNELKKELYRKVLDAIDSYNNKKFGYVTFRYYRFKNFEIKDFRN